MADEQHRAPLLSNIAHLAHALALELSIAHRQHLIHDEDFGFQVGGDSKSQAQVHPAGVTLHRRINKLLDL